MIEELLDAAIRAAGFEELLARLFPLAAGTTDCDADGF
jgi:hypothetical protein